jgi:hypothetical protein
MRKTLLFIGLIAVLVLAQSALAKGPPQKITISGDGLAGEIVIVDNEATLNALGMMALEDYDTLTPDAPDGIGGEGYLLTRFFEDSPDHYIPFDQVRYFAIPDGGRGYLQYVGIVGGSSEYDGKWFRPTPEGETTLRAVLARQQVRQDMIQEAAFWNALINMMALFGQ